MWKSRKIIYRNYFILKTYLPDELLNEHPRAVLMKTSGKGWRQVTWSYRIKRLCHSYKRKSNKESKRQKFKFSRDFIGMTIYTQCLLVKKEYWFYCCLKITSWIEISNPKGVSPTGYWWITQGKIGKLGIRPNFLIQLLTLANQTPANCDPQ